MGGSMTAAALASKARTRLWRRLVKERYLHLMIWPVIIWLIILQYVPMFGLQIAFKDYRFNKGVLLSPFVGLRHFRSFITDPYIVDVITNTLGMSLIKVFLMFPVPIVLAILLNEVRADPFRRTIQTISYFPHFISWTIVALMATTWLSPSRGFVNHFLVAVGVLKKPYLFLGDPKAFWWIALALEIWKSAGWGSIIYLAAIAGVEQEMYESAIIDGANRLQRVVHVTLPSILGTIMIMFIINVGNMLYGGLYASNFQVSYLLGNPLNNPRSEILDTYILKVGISLGRYSYATAVGLVSAIISFFLLITANKISERTTEKSLF